MSTVIHKVELPSACGRDDDLGSEIFIATVLGYLKDL